LLSTGQGRQTAGAGRQAAHCTLDASIRKAMDSKTITNISVAISFFFVGFRDFIVIY
jgi:hypothetical protein